MKDIKIQEVTENEIQTISNSYSSFDNYWNSNIFKQSVENAKCYVIKDFDNILRFVVVSDCLDCYEILNICVAKSFRNKKIRSCLLDFVLNTFKDKPIFLEVDVNNLNAIHLYEKFNFKQVNVRKNYYVKENISSDGIVMKREC